MTVPPPEEHSAVDGINPREQDERTAKSEFHRRLRPSRESYEDRRNGGDSVVRGLDSDRSHVAVGIVDNFAVAPARFPLRRARAAIPHVPVVEDGRRGEGPLGHVQHLYDVTTTRSSHVGRLLRLPDDDAGREEEEKAGEKDGEEDEEIDVQLVLAEEYHAVGGASGEVWVGRFNGAQDDVELGLAEFVPVLGQGQDEAVREVADDEEGVSLLDGDVGRESGGVAFQDDVLGARVPVGVDDGAVGVVVGTEFDDAHLAPGLDVVAEDVAVVLAPSEAVVQVDLGREEV